jgi:hypothetical protein
MTGEVYEGGCFVIEAFVPAFLYRLHSTAEDR